jgi:crotonobetainyl-CoA:carnitine CoA-transferase CaiB-like acyl-CoA transferase
VTKPFANVRIIDFTRVLAGPFASYQLALMGADVIKIEAHGGDDMRYGGADKAWSARGMAPGWLAVNANKRSLTLDLKKPEGIAIAKRLAESADVVIENFRPGVMDGLGIGYEALSAINPRLIYCAVSGFGQTGPERGAAAFDGMIQAMSGLMSITGHAETGPTRAGFPACDVTAGATAAFGVASALYQRTHTGRGQLVDVAMLDAMLAFLGGQVAEWTVTGKRPPQAGNLSVTRKPTGDMFPTADGYIVLAVMTDRQFESLMRAIGRPEAAADPRFADWDKRIANAGALRAIIVEALASAEDRHGSRHADPGRQRRAPGPRRPRHRPAAAGAGRAHRRDSGECGLWRGRDRAAEGAAGDLIIVFPPTGEDHDSEASVLCDSPALAAGDSRSASRTLLAGALGHGRWLGLGRLAFRFRRIGRRRHRLNLADQPVGDLLEGVQRLLRQPLAGGIGLVLQEGAVGVAEALERREPGRCVADLTEPAVMRERQVVQGGGVVGLERDCLAAVADRRFVLAARQSNAAEAVPGPGILRIIGDGALEMIACTLQRRGCALRLVDLRIGLREILEHVANLHHHRRIDLELHEGLVERAFCLLQTLDRCAIV